MLNDFRSAGGGVDAGDHGEEATLRVVGPTEKAKE